MFVIRANGNKMKFIKKVLAKEGLHVEDTILPDYILTVRNPAQYIPEQYKEMVSVQEFNDSYAHILKNRTDIKRMTVPSEQYKFGSPVKITDGQYAGFTGIVIDASDKKECLVEISVFGKIIKDTVLASEIEPYSPGLTSAGL